MTRWKDLEPGDRVELKGREWTVTALKKRKKGKPLTVTVARDGVEHTADVDPKSQVTSYRNAQRAEGGLDFSIVAENEAKRQAAERAKRVGDPWNVPRDEAEQRLEKLLGAELVGESTDAGATWAVPPVDVTTVAAHLVLMHGVQAWRDDEDPVELHEQLHADGAALLENHYHSTTRPKDEQ